MNGCEDPSLSYECDLTAERDALAAELASIKAHSKFQADCARQTSLALIDAGVKSFGFNADGVKALAARLAEAERERDKALVKADTLQFLVNQREITIDSLEREREALRELLRDIDDDLEIGAHPQLYRDRIHAALERQS